MPTTWERWRRFEKTEGCLRPNFCAFMRFLHNPMTKHLTDVSGIASEVTENLRVLRLHLGNAPEAEKALAGLESFVAVSLRVMAKTNPSKLRDCARAEYIKGLMDGSPEI